MHSIECHSSSIFLNAPKIHCFPDCDLDRCDKLKRQVSSWAVDQSFHLNPSRNTLQGL